MLNPGVASKPGFRNSQAPILKHLHSSKLAAIPYEIPSLGKNRLCFLHSSGFHLGFFPISIASLKLAADNPEVAMAMMTADVRTAIAVVAASVIVYLVMKFLRDALWEPLRLRRIMAKQGLRGPPFRFLFGQFLEMEKFGQSFPENLPLDGFANLSPTAAPQYALYFPKYGKMFVYWWGTMTKLVVRDAETVKELIINNHESLASAPLDSMIIKQILGNGLHTLQGEKWTKERQIITPFFHQDALKAMVEAMVKGAASEIQTWEQKVANGGGEAEIDVVPGIYKITGKVISLTAFGGDYEKGEQIFKLQSLLAEEILKSIRTAAYWLVPGYRNLPTKGNRLIDLYRSQVDSLLRSTIDCRREAVRNGEISSYGDDLLGRMLAAASEGWSENTEDFNLASVFNNCKLFYFAGQATVANTTNFAFLMLALYPEWQDLARKEVLEVFGDEPSYTASALSHLKVVGMIFNETLRLFPPAIYVSRVTTKDVQLNSLFVPKGVTIEVALTAIHQDKDYWGDDVGEFNPNRFANGVSQACSHRQAFIPFGVGPKSCVGSSFALLEAKIVLARVLQRFRILPSPNYKHHPSVTITLRPKFGMPVILKAL